MKFFNSILILIFTAVFLSCGSDKKKEQEQSQGIKINSPAKTQEKVDENVANVVISGDDLMKFDKKEIVIKSGQKVRLTLRHVGKLDIKVMGHNVVILKQGVDVSTFAASASTANDNQYIPKDTDDIIAHTNLIGGGQTTTIEFDAPPAGEYTFICSFPGHYAMMQGKFIVE